MAEQKKCLLWEVEHDDVQEFVAGMLEASATSEYGLSEDLAEARDNGELSAAYACP